MKHQEESRRGFLRKLGRLATAGLLAGGVVGLMGRGGERCLREFRCRDCPQLGDCGEPQAIMMRGQRAREQEARAGGAQNTAGER